MSNAQPGGPAPRTNPWEPSPLRRPGGLGPRHRRTTAAVVVAVLAGAGLAVGGAAAVLLALDRCRPADDALGARLLRSDVLVARPAGAEQTRAGSSCDGDDAWVVAERAYAFEGPDADVVSTYDQAARRDGWRLVATAADGSRCYERSLDGRAARLYVLPSGAPGGYSVTVLASRHDDQPCD